MHNRAVIGVKKKVKLFLQIVYFYLCQTLAT
jgi:hypothetical protein